MDRSASSKLVPVVIKPSMDRGGSAGGDGMDGQGQEDGGIVDGVGMQRVGGGWDGE